MQPNIRFPLFVDINNKNILVVGGGNIATRRVKTLLEFNCNVTVVSLLVSEYLLEQAREGNITIINRNFIEKDLDNIFLVIASTNVRTVNYSVGKLARDKGIFVSVADVKEESTFFFPAIAKIDTAVIAIGSDGENHHLVSGIASQIRNQNFQVDKTNKLLNTNILVTSPMKSKSAIVPKLLEHGAFVEHFPTIDIVEIEFDLPDLNEYTWIVFTSSASVNIFFNKYRQLGLDSRTFFNNKFAVVGSQTAKTLNSFGITADFIPQKFDGISLITELSNILNNQDKILLIRPQTNPEALRGILEEKQIPFYELSIYKTQHNSNIPKELINNIDKYDYITFTSSSCVDSFYKDISLNDKNISKKIKCAVCIGEKTEKTAKSYGINTIVSKISTIDSMIETIIEINNIKI